MIGQTNTINKINSKYEQLVNYTMLYDLGDECTDITGGWVSKTDTTTAKNNNIFTKNADNLYQQGKGQTGGTTSWCGRWFTNNKIDFSNIIKGLVSYTSTKTGTTVTNIPNVCVMKAIANTDSTPSHWVGDLPETSVKKVKLVSINSSIPNNYVSVGFVRNWYYYMYNFALLKQDNWQELCTIAGLTPSNYTNEATLCADSSAITTILSDKKAVQYMIYNCTGSFMGEFVARTNCLTALNNSQYKTIIMANEHWAKFLNMIS